MKDSIKVKEFQKRLKVPAKKIDALFKEFQSKCKFKERYGYCKDAKYSFRPAHPKAYGINMHNTVCCYGNCPYTIRIIN